MNEHDVLKKNRNFYIGVGGTVLEGLLSGSLFMLIIKQNSFLVDIPNQTAQVVNGYFLDIGSVQC